jgi:hypothetical protein
MNPDSAPPHIRAARQFYDGMTQATLESRSTILPRMMEQFEKRELQGVAKQAFNKPVTFHKRLLVGTPTPIEHTSSRFAIEFFCCATALNLYRMNSYCEQFKTELLAEAFAVFCTQDELEWLGVYGAEVVDMQGDTGHAQGQMRNDIIQLYLTDLKGKSSLDADTLIAVRRFLGRQELSKAHDIPVSPAMHEACAEVLETPAGWLHNYLKFHDF